MKRKLFIAFLTICCLLCSALFVACNPTDQGTATGPQDYKDGDAKIVTSLSYDIAETTEAFYIGSSAIKGVKVDGVEVDKNDYIVKSNYLLMPDGWYESIGVGVHSLTVDYKTKSLEFKFNISDNKALIFELPNIDKSFVPSDSAKLPTVEFAVPTQEKEVSYSIKDSKNKEVDFSIDNGTISIANPKEGEYTYSVFATRNGQKAIDETFSFKIVSREYYDGIIDPTNGQDYLDMWYVFDSQNTFGYADFADINGYTRPALYYNRVSKSDEHTRAIGINREKLLELITLGYTKLGFWYCLDIPELSTNIHISLYRDGTTWAASEFAITNVWTYKELDIAKFVTADMLMNDDSSKFVVGFITQNYNSSFQNEPLTAYFSEVVALGRGGDESNYLGTYSCGEDSIVLAENGVATIGGQTYSYWISNNYLVIDNGAHKYTSFVIDDGYIYDVQSKKLYQQADYIVNVDANVNVNVADSFKALKNNGVGYSVFLVEDGVDDGVADTNVVLSNTKTYSAKVMIDGVEYTFALKANLPTTTGNLAQTLYSSGKVSCYLANNQQTGELFHYGANNNLYFNCHNLSLANAMIFDNDFVKECFDNGLTCIKVTYSATVASDAWVRIAPARYDAVNGFMQFACANNTPALANGQTYTITWQLTPEEVQSIDFNNGFKLAISGLGCGSSKTQVVFSSFEFCAPEQA